MATSRLGLTTPSGTDALNNGDNAITANATILDNAALITSGVFSSRPTPATAGALNYYLATDTQQLFISTGSTWLEVAPGAGSVPIGGMIDYGGTTDPGDVRFVLADGRALSRTTYAGLFAVIGTTYGVGDGSTTFNLPDTRGRVTLAPDGTANRLSANDAIGNSGGEEKHTLTAAESGVNGSGATSSAGAHSHTITVQNNYATDPTYPWVPTHDSAWSTLQVQPQAGNTVPYLVNTTNMSYSQLLHGHPASADTQGVHTHGLTARTADSAHNNMQPYLVVQKIIRVS